MFLSRSSSTAINPYLYILVATNLVPRMLGAFIRLILIVAALPHVVIRHLPLQSKLARFPLRSVTCDPIFLDV